MKCGSDTAENGEKEISKKAKKKRVNKIISIRKNTIQLEFCSIMPLYIDFSPSKKMLCVGQGVLKKYHKGDTIFEPLLYV